MVVGQSLQSSNGRHARRTSASRSRRSIAVGASIALVAGMTGLVGGSAAATPSSPTPQPVANPATVTPQSTNPACEPATYVAAGFTYQAFTNLGDCDWVVPTGITTVDYVVIAGGGGGGVGRGGGGGAGGMLDDSATVTPGGTLTLTVGDGGAGGQNDQRGRDGQNSVLTGAVGGTVTAIGGGGGGAWRAPGGTNGHGSPGADGGSGGGGSGAAAGLNRDDTNIGGAGIPGQGFAGGKSSPDSGAKGCTGNTPNTYCAGGGGGGAGGVGLPGGQNVGVDDTIGGAGGPGRSVTWIDSTVALNLQIGDDSGGVVFFAGGGGGAVRQDPTSPIIMGIAGDGGVGGGGPGSSTTGAPAAPGVPGTGGGGGGNEGPSGPAGKGGSGIIVLKYASTAIPTCNPTLTTIKDSTFDDTVLTFGGVGTCEWTPPAGLTHLQFLLVGGGGGGGAAGGGGGGGGGILEDAGVAVSSGNAVTVTLGYGGLPGRVNGTGGSGAASQLIVGGTTYSAPAGSGGVSGVGGTGGAGGSGTGVESGGAGGAGAASPGAAGSSGNTGVVSAISVTDDTFGGGGGGGISTPNTGSVSVADAERGPIQGGDGGGGAGPKGSWNSSNPGGPGINGLGGGGGGGQTGGPFDGAGGRGGSGGLIIRYTTPLALASSSPASGPAGATTALTVTAQPGEGFQAGATVDVGGDPCVNVVIASPTSLTCEVRPTVVGTFDIQVTNGGVPGTVATLANAFTVNPALPGAPVISAAPGNTTAAVTWSVADTGGVSLTQVEFALDDTSTVYFTTTTVTSPTQLTGLANGQTYTVYARVVNSVGAGPWSLPAQVTPANPVPLPPSAPTSVRAVAGNASAVVSWSPPATSGSIPVSTYRVTAQPGGQGCLVAAPTLTCTITGLTNRTTYTFRVEALTGAGWSPAASSNPVTPGGVTPVPDPVPVPEPLVPGQSLLLVDGVPDTSVQVAPNTRENGLTIEGDDWSMDLDGLGPDGKPLNLGPNGALILNQQRQVQTTGRGFLASSDVNLYIDPPVQANQASSAVQGVASATGIFVGTLRTTRSGTFSGVVTLPAEIQPGEHILQVVGTGPGGDQRAMNLGVIVAPWIVLDQGTRTAQRGHDRIRTTGETGGFEAGTRLTPWIRYSGQSGFQQGRATIRVQADGSFTWTRKIRANRGLTAYVSFTDTESNRVVWRRVR